MSKVEYIEVAEQPRNYGKRLYTPLCSGASALCALTRHQSLTLDDIGHIKTIGIEVRRMVEVAGKMIQAETL